MDEHDKWTSVVSTVVERSPPTQPVLGTSEQTTGYKSIRGASNARHRSALSKQHYNCTSEAEDAASNNRTYQLGKPKVTTGVPRGIVA